MAGATTGGVAGAVVFGIAGAAVGVMDVAVQQMSAPGDNWAEVQAGTLSSAFVGGVAAAGRGFTSTSGGIAGGAISGFARAAGMPGPLADSMGGLAAGLGAPGRSMAQISRNMLGGVRVAGLAGLVGWAVEAAGNYLTDVVCQ